MMPPSRRICKSVLAAVLLLFPLTAAAQEKRSASTDGRFSFAAPKGLETETVKNAVAGWKHAKDRTTLGIFPVPFARKEILESAFKATVASREKAAAKGGDWFVSKVYKKTLDSGLPFYFYSAHQNGKIMKVSGYFVLGGDYYFVSGWTSRRKHGLPNVYAALATIQPIAGPRGPKALKGSDSQELLKRHGKKDEPAGVSLESGSTPRMLGAPKSLGAPKDAGGPLR